MDLVHSFAILGTLKVDNSQLISFWIYLYQWFKMHVVVNR